MSAGKHVLLRFMALIGVIGVVVMLVVFKESIIGFQSPTDFYESSIEDHKEWTLYEASFDMNTNLGYYTGITETTTHKNRGGSTYTTKSNTYYYEIVVPSDETSEGIAFMSVEVKESDKSIWSTVANDNTGKKVVGGYYYMEKLDLSDKKDRMAYDDLVDAVAKDFNLSKDVAKEYVKPYILKSMNRSHTAFFIALVAIGIGIAALVMFIKFLVTGGNRKKGPVVIYGMNYERAEMNKITKLMEKQKYDQAEKKLCSITGLPLPQVQYLLQHWNEVINA